MRGIYASVCVAYANKWKRRDGKSEGKCGEWDTWGRGTLPYLEPPPPLPLVAMQLCAERGCDSQAAEEKPSKGDGRRYKKRE